MPQNPWYKKTKYLVPGGVLALILVGTALAGGTANESQSAAVVNSANPSPYEVTPVTSSPAQTQTDDLSNENYYINSTGNTVHSPAYSETGTVPAGASAQCGDHTYSFSQHRSGTCSHHGGVLVWY